MSVHDSKTVRCIGELTDDDGEPITEEVTVQYRGRTETNESPVFCDTELSFTDHGRYERHLKGERRERFESSALVFTCPDCGHETAMCPVCSDPEDNSPGGWIDGSDGENIPCHNCNQREIAERRRRGLVR